jgi:hypothetical protein
VILNICLKQNRDAALDVIESTRNERAGHALMAPRDVQRCLKQNRDAVLHPVEPARTERALATRSARHAMLSDV